MNVQARESDRAESDQALARQIEGDAPDTTDMAMETTLLSPRFYTTNFDEMDAIDVSPVREDWDDLLAQMKSDPNKGHFKKDETWENPDWENMDPQLKRELIDFLVSSAPPSSRAACSTRR